MTTRASSTFCWPTLLLGYLKRNGIIFASSLALASFSYTSS
jgi:hypothetical protein